MAKAWMADERLSEVLYSMMLRLFAGGGAPLGFNYADMAFAPKGSEMSDSYDVVRGPNQLRPLSLKNSDAKAVAAVVNLQLGRLTAARAHP
eukprot:1564751-Pyramimonas_sp.AAC.1